MDLRPSAVSAGLRALVLLLLVGVVGRVAVAVRGPALAEGVVVLALLLDDPRGRGLRLPAGARLTEAARLRAVLLHHVDVAGVPAELLVPVTVLHQVDALAVLRR